MMTFFCGSLSKTACAYFRMSAASCPQPPESIISVCLYPALRIRWIAVIYESLQTTLLLGPHSFAMLMIAYRWRSLVVHEAARATQRSTMDVRVAVESMQTPSQLPGIGTIFCAIQAFAAATCAGCVFVGSYMTQRNALAFMLLTTAY